jgi:hypothetical protein
MSPAARILELKKRGHDIKTVLIPFGIKRRIGKYVLKEVPE